MPAMDPSQGPQSWYGVNFGSRIRETTVVEMWKIRIGASGIWGLFRNDALLDGESNQIRRASESENLHQMGLSWKAYRCRGTLFLRHLDRTPVPKCLYGPDAEVFHRKGQRALLLRLHGWANL
jgi:hypothetical protein